jgi:hypothetical protein
MATPTTSDFLVVPINGTDLIAFYRGSNISRPLYLSYSNFLAILTQAINANVTGLLLETNGVENPTQSILNLINGPGILITDNGAGGITITATGGGGGNVTGTGTPTRVAIWTGTTAIGDDSLFYWDNTNKALAIGATASPSAAARLYLFSSTNNADVFIESIFNQRLKFKNTTTSVQWHTSTNTFGAIDSYNIGQSSNPALGYLEILKSGRVKIGVNIAGTLGFTDSIMLELGLTGTRAGQMILNALTSGNITLKATDTTAPYTFTFPDKPISANLFLKTDASGNTSWATVTGTGTVINVATAGLISGGPITVSGTITTSMNTNKLVGRYTAGAGIMEEITLGTGFSFSGSTLNFSGGGPSAVTSVFGRTGAVIAVSGDYNTSQVSEVTNLYFTDARAIAALLTGYVSGAGTISASDSILTAIQKLNGNIVANYVPYTGATGAVNLGAFDLTVNNLTVGRGASALSNNTALGIRALFHITTGNYNTGIGYEAGHNITTGNYNTAIGQSALFTATSASQNTAIGLNALLYATSGISNVAVGLDTLQHITTGGSNTAIGYNAGSHITGGSTPNTTATNGVFIGRDSKAKVDGGANEIVIGQNAVGNGSNTATFGNTATTANYFTGSINGGSFVKSGGTSSQFLKADGSVDSSAYLGNTLANTNIFVGNASNLATAVAMSGDTTITNTGVVSLNTSFTAGSFGVTFDGGGALITNGKIAYVRVPYKGTITGWQLVADQSGSCSIAVKQGTFGGFPPSATILTAALSGTQTNPGTVSVSVAAGDWFSFTITGTSAVTWVNLSISITKII